MIFLIIRFGWQITIPLITLPSSNWQFWQYSEQGVIQGIKGPVDLNVFKNDNVNLESLKLK